MHVSELEDKCPSHSGTVPGVEENAVEEMSTMHKAPDKNSFVLMSEDDE